MSRKLRDLDERMQRVTESEHRRDDRAIYSRAIKCLTESEKDSLANAILATEKEELATDTKPTEAWLATRPQDQQAAVRKVLARIQELEQEGETN